jgi:hypothetical protein
MVRFPHPGKEAAPMATAKRSSPLLAARATKTASATAPTAAARRCRRKFLHYFPDGFRDETYLAWERDYKWIAHQRWMEALAPPRYDELMREGRFREIGNEAVRIESRTNLLFSFEKMALRDALKSPLGARLFAEGLDGLLHGAGPMPARFQAWCDTVARLPRRQTRVLTWPLATVFGFLAQPKRHVFYKPMVTRRAAAAYGHDLPYASRPSWEGYAALLDFVQRVEADIADLRPRDRIDVQSFLWVLGSDEYPD